MRPSTDRTRRAALQRPALATVLGAFALAASGCQLIARFDPARLDARGETAASDVAADVRADVPIDTSTDATDIAVEPSVDVVPDADDVIDGAMDTADAPDAVDAADSAEVASDAIDDDTVAPVDSSADAPVDAVVDAPVDTPADAPLDALLDGPVDAPVDTAVDAVDAETGGCALPTDCPGMDTECSARTCAAGACGVMLTAAGTRLSMQTAGDCQASECDGAGAVRTVAENTDVPVDGNQCTGDVCTAGVASNPITALGVSCTMGGTVCDGERHCVECNVAANCASGVCALHVCRPATCADSTMGAGETDVDCGGVSCAPCAVGRTCTSGSDCLTGSCVTGRCQDALIVVRVGAGTAALTSAATAVFLDRFSLTGSPIGSSVPLRTAVSGPQRRLVLSGTATSEGGISLSADGRYVTLAGYDANAGLAAISSTTATAAARVIARMNVLAAVDTSTVLGGLYSSNGVRCATSTNGTQLWASGAGAGVSFATLGATAAVQLSTTTTNTRWVGVASGQLYATGAAGTNQGVATVGTGLPITSGQTVTLLSGFPTASGPSPNGFEVLDLNGTPGPDRIYVADDRAGPTGGIQRWVLSGATWTLEYTLGVGGTAGARGVSTPSTADPITLYATTTDGRLVSVTDTGAASASATLATAAANTAYRGVALAPNRL